LFEGIGFEEQLLGGELPAEGAGLALWWNFDRPRSLDFAR
jgi:hypothetical protein